ncbi:MAG: hypothetical protein OEV94_06860 [Deltaproteobacteria bacterium]|nr:hypothetical protein [Deltaproteobacteria bacterium]
MDKAGTEFIERLDTIVLDLAESDQDTSRQEETSDVILNLLENQYQIFLFSSNEKQDLSKEHYEHPKLHFLSMSNPPIEALIKEWPALVSPHTLWVSESKDWQRWIGEKGLVLAAQTIHGSPEGLVFRFTRLGELALWLDPTLAAERALAEEMLAWKSQNPGKFMMVGIGGPPLSLYQQLSLGVIHQIERSSEYLVESLNLDPLLIGTAEPKPNTPTGWLNPAYETWFSKSVWEPLTAGKEVFIERFPEDFPPEIQDQAPLFLTPDSLVIATGEMMFFEPFRSRLALGYLVEVTPKETTRRLFELGEDGTFDETFVQQYMTHEGARYQAYMEKERVKSWASRRVSGEHPGVFRLIK